MKNIKHIVLAGVLLLAACPAAWSQSSPNCVTVSDNDYYIGSLFFNYGSTANAINTKHRNNITFGQPFVGEYFGSTNIGAFGFWARFLLAPGAPIVQASEGDLEDRVQVDWSPDPLSPSSTGGFNIYRNGALLAHVEPEVRNFVDFNVLAGKFYTYSVSGLNTFGEGMKGSSLGFLNPNGVVTGQVKSFSQNPVPGAIVTLTPTLGRALAFDGTDDKAFSEYNDTFPRSEFTLSCWVKLNDGNNNTGILDLGSSIAKNWWLHTMPGGQKGVRFGIGGSSVTELSHAFPAATASEWHHVAASYNGSSLLLYADGELVGTTVANIVADSMPLFFGRKSGGTHYYNGKLDEVRFFDRQLSQTNIQMFMNRTVDANAEGLVNYWKFDEGIGLKAFDQAATKQKVYLCGATWASDKPEVVNAGITDETGFYRIAGINYGAGTTFTATPAKSFYFNQSLEFNAANQGYADLTGFALTDSATVTVTVKAFDFSGNQAILSKANASGVNQFLLSLNGGNLELSIGAQMHSFGALGTGFHQLAMTLEKTGGSLAVAFFKDGVSVGTHTFSAVADWSGLPWKLGAKANGATSHSNYFTGLIDEAAFFDALLPLSDIQAAANVGTNVAHANLVHYFNLNEGSGTALHDMGTGLSGNGATHNADWSTVAAIEMALAHEFTPPSRLVTLDPSNTSADQIDFTDQSTIPVSGYVRFDGTTCFARGVEILVNGATYNPQILTDADGRFSADFEQGADVVLTPKFENHTFYPPDWELENLATPVAGILFRDQTKRKVHGQLAGGHCRKSIIPDASIVQMKVETLNGCYSQVITLPPGNGKFTFSGVPPDSVTVALIQYSPNPAIYNYFQNLGGATLDLKMEDDTIDFIYFAPPEVELTPLDTNICGDPMLDQGSNYKTTVKVFENYVPGGQCYLDTALLTFDNDIADLDQFDTLMTGGSLIHRFKANSPNIVSPYLKTLQVTAEAHDELATQTLNAVVLGRRARESTFATTAPELPTLILRDPPGDASNAYLEEGETTCQNWSYSAGSNEVVGQDVTLSFGIDVTTSVGAILMVETEIDNTNDLGFTATQSFSNLATHEVETCFTATTTVSTGDNDVVVGSEMGGDVYMGGALNYIFGITDELLFDTMLCAPYLDPGLSMQTQGFATTFIYTEYHILNVVIPNLLTIGDTASAERWQGFIDLNTQLKADAVFSKNISFDAGVTYEESETSEVTKTVTYEWNQEFSEEFSYEYGVTADGAGIVGGVTMGLTTSMSSSNSNSQTSSRTVGFTLADDDIGDNFTVNILKDKTYGTPVFELVSGQTSCPHEPNSQPRDGVDLATNQNVAINVPMNDAAVFILTLGNTSQSEEAREYTLSADQLSNPDGAIIRFNGETSLTVELEPNEGMDVTMTVERGPVLFTYLDLSVSFSSDCDGNFSESLTFDVFFLEPCSEVDVTFPLEDWVLIPADGNILNITTSLYDVSDPDLQLIRVQYRRTNGDGAWINIAEIPKADLGAISEITPWNTQGLQDGLYEIRAVTQCFSGALNPGISHIIHGKFERTAPEIFGTPQPSDGVLGPNDEISITFTEPIRCDLLISADFFENNNVGLYNTVTGDLVDATITCSGDKITIVPAVANMFIENEILRVEINDIKDLANNVFDHADWEFFVDRNSLRWVGPPIEKVVNEGESLTVIRGIENSSGAAAGYTITGIPEWVDVLPTDGFLPPGGTQIVTFKFSEDLPQGNYLDTILLESALGDEPMIIHFRVLCEGPQWEIDPTAFSNSMNFTVELNIEGDLSEDNMDLVAAFVEGELRGVAHIQYEPSVDKYLAFLTVYSNEVAGEALDFQIWDADACLLYGEVMESFNFSLDGLVGSPLVPQVLHTNNLLLRKIPIHPGWNWISFNLNVPDKSIGNVLSSLQHPQSGLIKSQTLFSQYSTGLAQWIGGLTTLGYKPMYQYKSSAQDTIVLVGARIDPDTVNIPVNVGWNWIGYLPYTSMSPDSALASLNPLNGDVLKSQTTFAQFVAGSGWIGNLNFLSAPNGYLLKISNPGVLNYPGQNLTGGNEPSEQLAVGGGQWAVGSSQSAAIPHPSSLMPIWTVDPSQFEHSMNVIAIVGADENLLEAGDVLGAFVGDEVRGGNEALWVEPLQAWLVFLTAYANGEGEELTFKYYDSSAEDIFHLNETMPFAIDLIQGTVEEPQVFTLEMTGTATNEAMKGNWFEVYPNPAGNHVFAAFGSQGNETAVLRISDSLGRLVKRLEISTLPGLNVVKLDSGGFASGSYFLSLTSNGETVTKRVIK